MTLQHLAEKAGGRPVGWLNIADARALSELGWAERCRDGWRITAAGTQALAEMSPGAGLSVNVIQASTRFRPRKPLT